jgi:hypothetical protein
MIMLFSVYRYETPLKLLMDGYLKTGEVIIGDEEPRLKGKVSLEVKDFSNCGNQRPGVGVGGY